MTSGMVLCREYIVWCCASCILLGTSKRKMHTSWWIYYLVVIQCSKAGCCACRFYRTFIPLYKESYGNRLCYILLPGGGSNERKVIKASAGQKWRCVEVFHDDCVPVRGKVETQNSNAGHGKMLYHMYDASLDKIWKDASNLVDL